MASGHIVSSENTFNEITNVLVRPKFDNYLSLEYRLTLLDDLKNLVRFISITNKIDICRDPKDNRFLELAVEAGAACIITGDKDLLVLNPFKDIPILTPAEFLEKF